jgi:hypothetical protein
MINDNTHTDTSDSRDNMDTKQATNIDGIQTGNSTQWAFFDDDYFTETDEEVFINNDDNEEEDQTDETDKVEFQSANLLQKIRDPEYDFSSDWNLS